jgi:hypothetical protein
MAPRAYWKGYLKLSLVSCPIALFPATSEREKITGQIASAIATQRFRHRVGTAIHLFRECWVVGTGSDTDLCRVFGWEVEAHRFKVAMAADLVALWHNGRITVDPGHKEVSAAAHARSVVASQA